MTQPAGGMEPAAALLTTLDSPWGPLHVAVTERGIAAVSWLSPVEDVRVGLARRLGVEVVDPSSVALDDPRRRLLEEAVTTLGRWNDGQPETFGLPIDLRGLSDWDQAVLDGVRRIPWGHTESYGGVARSIGRPGAARAVGGAVSRNPIGVIVPCHRVIAGDGTLGGYGGDAWGSRESRLDLKRALLRLEGVVVDRATD